jgi:ubiquinone/menaquinone biosynthesis C-methylase UbiE
MTPDKVSVVRWQQAQRWEAELWDETQRVRARYGKNIIWRILRSLRLVQRYRGNDWNTWWRDRFDGYRFLPPRVGDAIEVGCGPYTNMRYVLEACRPERLVLSDPLIERYRHYQLTFLSEVQHQPWCQLDNNPLENLPFAAHRFDLVVMINVLDHVQDAHACMQSVLRILRPSGWLILGQDLTNEADLAVLAQDPGLVGHPIKLSAEWFDPYLRKSFTPAIHQILPREEGREPTRHYATLLFAGQSSPGPSTPKPYTL